jgi:uncharacterized RDD family membrane protein YckC
MKKYYGGFWSRFSALVIDTIFLIGLSGMVNLIMGLNFFKNDPSPKLIYASLFSMIVSLLYYSIFQGMFYGTFGKKIMGLRLVDAKTLQQVSIGQAFGRYAMQFVSGICLGLGYFNVAMNDRKQGWHDKAAGTLVIKNSMLKKLQEEEGILPKKKKVIPQSVVKRAA